MCSSGEKCPVGHLPLCCVGKPEDSRDGERRVSLGHGVAWYRGHEANQRQCDEKTSSATQLQHRLVAIERSLSISRTGEGGPFTAVVAPSSRYLSLSQCQTHSHITCLGCRVCGMTALTTVIVGARTV